jgi:hypothetical protein
MILSFPRRRESIHDVAQYCVRDGSPPGRFYPTLLTLSKLFLKAKFPLETILIYRRLAEDILSRAQSKSGNSLSLLRVLTNKIPPTVNITRQHPIKPNALHINP